MSTSHSSQKTSNDAILTSIITNGDLSKLSADQKVSYYRNFCERLGLDPISQPFKLLRLNGREVLYCDRTGAQQLNKLHGVSHEIRAREIVSGCYVVTAQASTFEGRHTEAIGAVPIENLKGDNLCNAMMKAETKAKRRATLDLLGLGILDETETESIPGASQAPAPVAPAVSGNAAPPTPPTPPVSSTVPAVDDKNGEARQKEIDARLKLIREANTPDSAIELYATTPEPLKGDRSFKMAVDKHLSHCCAEKWADFKKKQPKYPMQKPEENTDPMKVKYPTPAALEQALGNANTVSQLADLYYTNIETIENNKALKALFTARKAQINRGTLPQHHTVETAIAALTGCKSIQDLANLKNTLPDSVRTATAFETAAQDRFEELKAA